MATTALALPPILTLHPRPAAASKLPAAADAAWAAVTGAPPDLFFPSAFLGTFDAASTLVSADAPLGEGALPPGSAAALARARAEDLGKTLMYRARWIRAPRPPTADGEWAILDRAFNAAALLSATLGVDISPGDVAWEPTDPNDVRLALPGRGGMSVFLRVTKRSEELVAPDRLTTSEFVRQEVSSGTGGPETEGGPARPPRVTASQCFSKWHWRDVGQAGGGPSIIATQVVSSFLTPDDPGGPAAMAAAGGKPVVVYTYRLALTPVQV